MVEFIGGIFLALAKLYFISLSLRSLFSYSVISKYLPSRTIRFSSSIISYLKASSNLSSIFKYSLQSELIEIGTPSSSSLLRYKRLYFYES